MSTPIGIPKQQPHRQGLDEKASVFPESEGPYMGYTEVLENGLYYSAISTGSSKFVPVGPGCLPTLSFLISKYRARHRIEIDVISRDLREILCVALNISLEPHAEMLLSITEILLRYDFLREVLVQYSTNMPDHESTKELRLLMEDAVLERSLYSGFDINMWCKNNVLNSSLLQDIHLRNMDLGMMDIEECFCLGNIIPSEENKYLADQTVRIDKLARNGNLNLLQEYCEPLLRSRDIKIVFDPSLMTELLDGGFVDSFKYILELVERTRPMAKTPPSPDYADVTYHPLCVAIRLGHYLTVRTFVETEYQIFEGCIEDAPRDKDRVFDPLLAAVLWARSDIVRLLLRNGPTYSLSFSQAHELATQMGLSDVLKALRPLHKPTTPAFDPMNAKYPAPKDLQLFSSARLPPKRTSFLPSPPGSNSSISGISSGLHGPQIDPQSDNSSSTNSSTMNCATTAILAVRASSSTTLGRDRLPMDPSSSEQVPSPPSTPQPNPKSSDNVPAETPNNVHYPSKLVDYTSSYRLRYGLGRDFQLRLRRLCRRIDKLCGQHSDSSRFGIIRKQCTDANTVLKPGLSVLRNIMRNQVPSELVPLLQALLVADALICTGSDRLKADRLKAREKEFTDDLGRWKVLVLQREEDLDLFDEVACAAWKIDHISSVPGISLEDDLYRFSDLVEDLVSHANIKPPDPKPYGTRLRVVQRHFKDYERCTQSNMQTNRVVPAQMRNMNPNIEAVKPKVVLLLHSVVFDLLFTTSSSIQDIEDNYSSQPLLGTPASIIRSSMIVEEYLSFDSKIWGSHDSGIGMDISDEDLMESSVAEMANANGQARTPTWYFPGPAHQNAESLDPVERNSDRTMIDEDQATDMPCDYPQTSINAERLDTVNRNSNETFPDEEQATDMHCDYPPTGITGDAPGSDAV